MRLRRRLVEPLLFGGLLAQVLALPPGAAPRGASAPPQRQRRRRAHPTDGDCAASDPSRLARPAPARDRAPSPADRNADRDADGSPHTGAGSTCATGGSHTDTFDGARNAAWSAYIPQPDPTFSLANAPGCEELSVPNTRIYDAWSGIDNAPELLRSPGPGGWSAATALSVASADTTGGGFHSGLTVRLGGTDQLYWGLYQSSPTAAYVLRLERSGINNIAQISGVGSTAALSITYSSAGGACRYNFAYALSACVLTFNSEGTARLRRTAARRGMTRGGQGVRRPF